MANVLTPASPHPEVLFASVTLATTSLLLPHTQRSCLPVSPWLQPHQLWQHRHSALSGYRRVCPAQYLLPALH